jgi:F-type H+-transporting ATPase subunit gamma
MASLQDIRRRIRSVKNTQQVTKAMKMISAVKMRKSQERLLSMRPFAIQLSAIVGQVAACIGPDAKFSEDSLAEAFFSPREEKNIHMVVIASDKGLCGGYNANLIKAAEAFLHGHPSQITKCGAIGRRAVEWARKAGLRPSPEAIALPASQYLETAGEIASAAVKSYVSGEIDALYIVYNHFNSAVSQVPKVSRIFPPSELPEARGVAHLLEPDAETVFQELLPQYIETEIYRIMLESAASEHAARMAAMDKATSNASEMIGKLTLHMNKVRQTAITNQIIEVVSGAAS